MNHSAIHVCISTGQNVANFIPIREMGKPGDKVLIVDSDTARARNLTNPLVQQLLSCGFEILESLKVTDLELVQVYPLSLKLEEILRQTQSDSETVYFYFNGGQKMAALGMYEVAQKLNSVLVYLDYPAIRLIVTDSRQQSIQFKAITHDIHLPDLLSFHNTKISEKSERIKRLSRSDIRQYQPDAVLDSFYQDAELVRGILKTMWFAQNYEENLDKFVIPGDFKVIGRQQFEEQLQQYLRKQIPQSPFYKYIDQNPNSTEYQRVFNFLFEFGKNAFSKYPKLVEQFHQQEITVQISNAEKQKLVEIGWLKPDTDPRAVIRTDVLERLGPFFEKVVENRFLLFLKNNPPILDLISEIWTNVKFEATENPGKHSGEYDILILLKSGVLISLECKTYRFEEKDMFARVARLVRRSGLLNEQWASLMMFTDESLVQETNVDTYLNLQKLGIPLIPFGLQGQPDSLLYGKMEEPVKVPDFEMALQKNFAKYLPSN
jgi:hypothetical protein